MRARSEWKDTTLVNVNAVTLLVMLAGSCGGCARRVKVCGAAAGSGGAGYPVGDPGDVAGHRGENVLDVGTGQAPVTGAAQAVGPDVLRERGLDAGADRLAALPLLGPLVESVAQLDLVQRPGEHGDGSGPGG